MSKVEAVILPTKPHRPVDYNEAQLQAVLDGSYLIADKKEDGVRLNLCVQPSLALEAPSGFWIDWLSREGKRFPAIAEGPLNQDPRWLDFFGTDEALFPEGFMLDAELLIDDLKCKDIAGTLRRQEEIDLSRLKVVVFGILPLEAVRSGKTYEVPHSVMKYHVEYQVALLQKRFPEIQWEVVESIDVFSLEELHQFNDKIRGEGGEGVVAKDPNGFYKRSKQVGMWKVVPKDNEDGKVVGLVWGTEGKANQGRVIGFEVLLESGHVVNACKISQAQMEEFTKAVFKATDMKALTWVNPYEGWTCKVTFMERYENGSLRHPSFDSFRGISDPLIKE
ncbi:hypothetical protein GV819_15950 [Pseudomonas sp. Fl5BN2]|uniref:ATP-dependent DNA ligase n=1 Tax=Pseudomonas sp. Fl5BN2 TaxID=2697652 RepID=UPI001377AF64|nr:hypothetical protein [Pseudomonas sp. Fl5BN2]NBF03787.1 hypothetical protein [Pseudomonas sp. Fl5BN2]